MFKLCNTGGAVHSVEVPGKVFTARFGTLLLTQKCKAREKKKSRMTPKPFSSNGFFSHCGFCLGFDGNSSSMASGSCDRSQAI